MNGFFQNMLPYEVILVIMGMVLFLALVFLLIWSVMKKRSVTTLLPFFLLPVIMVAYPTIKSIKIGNIAIDNINKVKGLTDIVTEHPADTAAAGQLKDAVAQLKATQRIGQNGTALLTIANAQMALGKYDSASLYLDKAIKVAPAMGQIDSSKQALRQKIKLREDFSKNIGALNDEIEQLKKSPDDTQSVQRITDALTILKYPDYVHPNEALTLAKCYAIAGDRQQSLNIITRLDTTVLDQGNIVDQLKDSIRNNTYQLQFFRHAVPPKTILLDPLKNKRILDHVTTP